MSRQSSRRAAELLAQRLLRARHSGSVVSASELSWLSTTDLAGQVLLHQVATASSRVIGWKIGAASQKALRSLRLRRPFAAPIFSFALHADRVPLTARHRPVLEVEFAVIIGRRIPFRVTLPDPNSILESIDEVRLALEVAAFRVGGRSAAPGLVGTADGGSNAAIVLGPEIRDWRTAWSSEAGLELNGRVARRGSSDMLVWQSLPAAISWVSKQDVLRDRGLLEGDVVMTGTCVDPLPVRPGDTIRATLGGVSMDCRFDRAHP